MGTFLAILGAVIGGYLGAKIDYPYWGIGIGFVVGAILPQEAQRWLSNRATRKQYNPPALDRPTPAATQTFNPDLPFEKQYTRLQQIATEIRGDIPLAQAKNLNTEANQIASNLTTEIEEVSRYAGA